MYIRIYIGRVTTASSAAETDSNAQHQANVINTNSLHYVCPLQPLSALRVPLNHDCWGCFSSGRFSSSPSLLARDLGLPLRSWFCRMERGASHGSRLRDPRPVVSTQAGLLCVEGHPDGNRMTGVIANIVTVVTTWDLQYKWLTAHGTEPAKAMTWKSKSETLVFTDQGFTYAAYSSTCERHVLFYNMYLIGWISCSGATICTVAIAAVSLCLSGGDASPFIAATTTVKHCHCF